MPVDLYKPALVPAAATGSSLRGVVIDLLLAVVLPEAGLPLLFANFLTAITQPEKLNAYLGILNNLTGSINNVLQMIKLAQDIGFIGENQGDQLKRIADSLYCEVDGEEIGVACFIKKMATYTITEGEHEGESVDLAQVLYNMYSTMYFKLSDGTYIPLTDALTRLTLSGITRNYMTIPLNGGGGA